MVHTGTKMRLSRILSAVTVPSGVALLAVTWIYIRTGPAFGGIIWYLCALAFLVLIPVLPYLIPRMNRAGRAPARDTERRTAIIVGVLSYAAGTAVSWAFDAPLTARTIFTAYFLSGLVLSAVNALFRFKASGHACGVTGPATLLAYYVGLRAALVAASALPLVFWSRLTLRRHTLSQLLAGSVIGICSTLTVLVVL